MDGRDQNVFLKWNKMSAKQITKCPYKEVCIKENKTSPTAGKEIPNMEHTSYFGIKYLPKREKFVRTTGNEMSE